MCELLVKDISNVGVQCRSTILRQYYLTEISNLDLVGSSDTNYAYCRSVTLPGIAVGVSGLYVGNNFPGFDEEIAKYEFP